MSGRDDRDARDRFRRFGIERNVRSAGSLDLLLRRLVRLLREIHTEARSRTGIPWRRRLRAWRKGFRSRHAALYGVDDGDDSGYVPDFPYAWRSYAMNGFWNPIVGNKLVVSQILAARGIPHPRVFGVVSHGRPLTLNGGSPTAGLAPLRDWTSDARPVVFRPHWSGGGEGVFFLRRQDDAWFVNGRDASTADVAGLIGGLDRYIATAFVDQAAYARAIHAPSTNTLRVLTLADGDGPFIASVVHRFGTSRSFPVDNFHQGRGGVCAAVDAATETLGTAVSLDRHNRRVSHAVHPETGSPIAGVAIPGLKEALDGVLAAAGCFPEATCVGWDLLMTDDGYSILEANAPPGIVVSQAHAPLLANPRAAAYFARYGFAVPPRATTRAERAATARST